MWRHIYILGHRTVTSLLTSGRWNIAASVQSGLQPPPFPMLRIGPRVGKDGGEALILIGPKARRRTRGASLLLRLTAYLKTTFRVPMTVRKCLPHEDSTRHAPQPDRPSHDTADLGDILTCYGLKNAVSICMLLALTGALGCRAFHVNAQNKAVLNLDLTPRLSADPIADAIFVNYTLSGVALQQTKPLELEFETLAPMLLRTKDQVTDLKVSDDHGQLSFAMPVKSEHDGSTFEMWRATSDCCRSGPCVLSRARGAREDRKTWTSDRPTGRWRRYLRSFR